MARIFITGSTDGLGHAAAKALIYEGHQVVVHARSRERAAAVADLASRSAGVVVGDLGSARETHSVADQVNAIGSGQVASAAHSMHAPVSTAAVFPREG